MMILQIILFLLDYNYLRLLNDINSFIYYEFIGYVRYDGFIIISRFFVVIKIIVVYDVFQLIFLARHDIVRNVMHSVNQNFIDQDQVLLTMDYDMHLIDDQLVYYENMTPNSKMAIVMLLLLMDYQELYLQNQHQDHCQYQYQQVVIVVVLSMMLKLKLWLFVVAVYLLYSLARYY